MAETRGPYRLLSPLSRMETDAEGKPVRKRYEAGEIITPSQAELEAFGDRLLDASTGAPATGAEPTPAAAEPPAEDPVPRSRR